MMGTPKLIAPWLGCRRPSNAPALLGLRSSKELIIFVVAFATFTDYLLYGMIIPVIPTALSERVEPPVEDEQRWVSILLALYGAAQLLISPVAGYATDRVESRRWPLIVGLILLAVGTAMLCIGSHLSLWIAGRILQGASTAIVFSAGWALLVDTAGDCLGTALGYVAVAMTTGFSLGPLLGGILYEHAGYYAVFGLALGLIGIDLVLRLIIIEKRHAQIWLVPERPSATVQEEAPSDPIIAESSDGPATEDMRVQAIFQSKAMPSPDKFTTYRTHENPLERDSLEGIEKAGTICTLLASRRLWAAISGYFVVSVLMSSLDTVIPLFVHDTFSWSQTAQGLIFLCQCIPHVLDPVVGLVNDRYKKLRRYLTAGALLMTTPMCVLLRLVSHNTIEHKVLLCALLGLIGVSMAVLLPILFAEVSYVVSQKEQDQPGIFGHGGAMALAYGIWNAVFAAGSIVGPFFSGFVRDYSGWGTMSWALGLVTGLPSVSLLLFLGGSIFGTDNIAGID